MKCLRCGRRAAFELRYSGHWVCRRHFIELFERRVKKTIRQNRLLSRGEQILVGLSGGKDSMTVLKILSDITSPVPDTRLTAVTIDEGIRGKSLKKVADFCRRLGVEHRIATFKENFGLDIDEVFEVIKPEGVPPCSICGALKRRLLNDYAKEVGATKVATGHNLDDEIQTAFMNIVRGDLRGMARLDGEAGETRHGSLVPRIMPLRECPEDEVRAYADMMKLPYADKRCPYSRSSDRTTARKLLDCLERNHPGSKYQMLRSVDGFSKVMKEQVGGQDLDECERCGEASAAGICKTCMILEELGIGRMSRQNLGE